MKIRKALSLGLAAVMTMGMLPAIPAAAEEPITITIVDWNTGAASDLQKAACQEYMDSHPGIIIDHPAGFPQALQLYLFL